MSEFRLETLTMPAASMGAESPWPALQPPGKDRSPREDIAAAKADSQAHKKLKPAPDDPAVRYGGMYDLPDCLPYAVQDGFNRDRKGRDFPVVVLENEHLEATFILELGGRLWSLVHKPTGKRLVDPNAVFQPTLLARRGAWISGGCEWNATPGGHSPQNCDPPFAARLMTNDGAPVLRLYEWERIARIAYQVDCWLPDGSEFLYARVRVTNPHERTIPMYWWTNIAVDLREGSRVIVPATDAMSWGYSGAASTVPIPFVGDIDSRHPSRPRVRRIVRRRQETRARTAPGRMDLPVVCPSHARGGVIGALRNKSANSEHVPRHMRQGFYQPSRRGLHLQ